MSAIKLVLIDLSGTLHVGKKAIQGCPAALEKLEKWAKDNRATFRFLSNTTKDSKASLVETLQSIGFGNIRAEKVITPLQAAGDAVRAAGAKNPLCLLNESSSAELGLVLDSTKPYDSVVLGLSPDSFHYEKLNQAFRLLKEVKVPFIATHRGRYFRDESGQLSMGPGPFVAALEEAAGVKATTVGKPNRSFYEAALRQGESELGEPITPASVVMIGDDLRDDIQGARDLGYQTVLVRTGKFKPEDATGADVCLDSFAHFVDSLVSANFPSLAAKKTSSL